MRGFPPEKVQAHGSNCDRGALSAMKFVLLERRSKISAQKNMKTHIMIFLSFRSSEIRKYLGNPAWIQEITPKKKLGTKGTIWINISTVKEKPRDERPFLH